MTTCRPWRVIVLLVCLGVVALPAPQATADRLSVFHGASYLITIQEGGLFASRGVLTLHSDGTMSAIDSGQGGPFHFTSQLGAWARTSPGGGIGRTLDFDFPPSPDVARLDYTFTFSADGTHVTGTITLRTFPLQSDPLDGGGLVVGEFTFAGTRVTP